MTACQLCEGPRDVTRRRVLDVDLDICRHCWSTYGPDRPYVPYDVYLRQVAEAEAIRDDAHAEAVAE